MEADQIPAELIDAAARAVFESGEATFDRMDPWEVYVPKKWDDRTEDEKDEVREPTQEALAAVYCEIQARALEAEADRTHTFPGSYLVHDDKTQYLLRKQASALRAYAKSPAESGQSSR